MTWSRNTQLSVLLSLVGVLFLSLLLNRKDGDREQTSSAGAEVNTASIAIHQDDQLPAVELLHKQPIALEKLNRNIFEFQEKAVSDENSGKTYQDAPLLRQPEVPEIHYLGLYEEKGPSSVRLAAVSNGGKIYVGGVGQTLAGKYRVLEIEDEFLVLRILSDNRILRFPLGRKGSPVEIKERKVE